MDAKSRSFLLAEARRWQDLGLLPAASLPQIEALYTQDGEEGPSFSQLALLSLAGTVLGAAFIALVTVVLRLHSTPQAYTLAALGTASLVVGGAASLAGGRPAWADTLLTAGAIAYAFMVFPDARAAKALCALALLGGMALPLLGNRRGAVASLGAALFMTAGFAAMMQWFSTPGFIFDNPTKVGATTYFLLAGLYVAAMALGRRRLGQLWPGASGVAALAFVVPLGFFLDTVVLPHNNTGGLLQILLALGEGLLLWAAFMLQDRAMVIGSSIGVAGATVAFAFDVGGPILGVLVLLVVAAALVGLAFVMRRESGVTRRAT